MASNDNTDSSKTGKGGKPNTASHSRDAAAAAAEEDDDTAAAVSRTSQPHVTAEPVADAAAEPVADAPTEPATDAAVEPAPNPRERGSLHVPSRPSM